MGKLLTGMAVGVILGMHYADMGKKLCMRKLKKQCMHKLGL